MAEAPRPRLPLPPAPQPVTRTPDEVTTSDGLPIMPPGANDPRPDGPVHPHPITPQHQRIYARTAWSASSTAPWTSRTCRRCGSCSRSTGATTRKTTTMLQDGYAVIADCLEHPGEATRAAATQWAETHRGSTLRRFVNRHCLE